MKQLQVISRCKFLKLSRQKSIAPTWSVKNLGTSTGENIHVLKDGSRYRRATTTTAPSLCDYVGRWLLAEGAPHAPLIVHDSTTDNI